MLLAREGVASNLSLKKTKVCDHCGEFCDFAIEDEDLNFCCHGCQSVYYILRDNKLEHFYQLKEDIELTPLRNYQKTDFSHFADLDFLQKFDLQKSKDSLYQISFYLENVKCIACLWLIEQLPRMVRNVEQAELNYTHSVLKLTVKETSAIVAACEWLDSLGYKPMVLKNRSEVLEKSKNELDQLLKKTVVAGMLGGNIMLFSVSIYAGADLFWLKWFNLISTILYLPVFFYSATPFYRALFSDIRLKQISLNSLVGFAILLASVMSFMNVVFEKDTQYYDSMSVLVFLLLFSRYFIKKTQYNILKTTSRPAYFQNEEYLCDKADRIYKIHELKQGQQIKVKEGQLVPCRAKLLTQEAHVNRSFLTGESQPVKVLRGESLKSGDKSLSPCLVELDQDFSESSLSRLFDDIEDRWGQKNNLFILTEKYLKRLFQVIVIAIFAVTGFHFLNGTPSLILDKVLALLIITCPCSVGLGLPLVLTMTLKKLSRHGILVNSIEEYLQLNEKKHIFFDKTGTLTVGEPNVTKWSSINNEEVAYAVYQLETRSSHPIAKSLVAHIEKFYSFEVGDVDSFKENIGQGVEGTIFSTHWELKKSSQGISLLKDRVFIEDIIVQDDLHPLAKEVVQELQDEQKIVHIISGDQERKVRYVANELGVSRFCSNCLPNDKAKKVAQVDNAIMIGDGLNDLEAMKEASVSVGIKSNLNLNLLNIGINIVQGKLKGFKNLMIASKMTQNTLRQIIFFSLIYNMIGVSLSVLGFMTPLIAAVLMPISVVVIVSLSLIQVERVERLLWK